MYFKVFRKKLYQLNTKLLERFSKKSGNDLVTVLIALLFNVFPLAHNKYTKKQRIGFRFPILIFFMILRYF